MLRAVLIAAFALSVAVSAADKPPEAPDSTKTPVAKGAKQFKQRMQHDHGGKASGNSATPLGAGSADTAHADARDTKDAKGGKDAAKDGDKKGDAKPRDAGAAALAKDEDYIETVLGDLIYGKIHKELPDYVVMLMRDDKARVRVPREKIKTINFSMGTRLAALQPDDYAGQYKVGLWAMEKNMYPEAINLFETLKKAKADNKEGAENIDEDMLKQLGRAYEARGQLDKALANYEEYAQGHKEDAEVAAVIKKLEAVVKPQDTAADPAVTAAAKPKHVDGLEADGNWQAEKWDNANPSTIQFTTDKEGNKMIVVQSEGGGKDKMAFSRYGQPPLNLTDSTDMIFKAFNDGEKPITIACAFVNAEGDFHESHGQRIMPKQWMKLDFKIEGKVFKSTRNDFKEYNQELKGREHITRITLMIYDQRPVRLFIDSVFFK
jgi:tetratricopeptide (TPR) repeat protein